MIDASELRRYVPERTLADVFAGRVTIVLGGQTYVLPALAVDANEDWLSHVDAEFGTVLTGLDDDEPDIGAWLNALSGNTDHQLALIAEWDRGGLLPAVEELRSVVLPIEVLIACLILWRVARPLVDMAEAGSSTNGTSHAHTSSRPTNGARGTRKRSARR